MFIRLTRRTDGNKDLILNTDHIVSMSPAIGNDGTPSGTYLVVTSYMKQSGGHGLNDRHLVEEDFNVIAMKIDAR